MAGTLSLPPQVNGRIHGSLRLAVERISWRVVRPPDSSQVTAVACGVGLCSRAPRAPTRSFSCRVCNRLRRVGSGARQVVGGGGVRLAASPGSVHGLGTRPHELPLLLYPVQQVCACRARCARV
jgi:hypothetical protein